MAQGVAWMARELGVPATIIGPTTRRRPSSRRSSAWVAASSTSPGTSGGRRWRRAAWTASTALRPSRPRPARHGGQRDDRARARGASRRHRRRSHPLGRRRADDRDRERARGSRPETRIVVVEPETGAPVAAAFANGGVPVPVEYTPSFIDGAGSGGLLPGMWERAEPLSRRRSRSRSRRPPRP